MAAANGEGDGLEFDKDDQIAMNFVAAASNLRSRIFQVHTAKQRGPGRYSAAAALRFLPKQIVSSRLFQMVRSAARYCWALKRASDTTRFSTCVPHASDDHVGHAA